MADGATKRGIEADSKKNIKADVRRRIERIETAPERVLERLTGGTGSLIDAVWRVIKVILKWGLVVGAFLLIVVVPIQCARTGTCGVLLDNLRFGVGETPIGIFLLKGGQSVIDTIIDPTKLVTPGGPLSFDQTQEEVEEYGIDIVRFRPDGIFELGEPISATAEINFKAPEDYDLIVDFKNACSMEDYNGRINVQGSFDSEKTVRVNKGDTRNVGVSCEFLDGVKELESDVDTRTISLNPKYGMKQDVAWKVYSKNTKGSEKTLGETRAVSKGPMVITLFSLDSQPFYRGTTYRLTVKLDNNGEVWRGQLSKIDDIKLIIPENVKLNVNDQFCDFEDSGNGEYSIKQKVLAQANYDCGLTDFLIANKMTREECYDNFKEELQYSCRFVFNEAESIVSEQEFKAIVDYVYVAEDRTILTLSKKL